MYLPFSERQISHNNLNVNVHLDIPLFVLKSLKSTQHNSTQKEKNTQRRRRINWAILIISSSAYGEEEFKRVEAIKERERQNMCKNCLSASKKEMNDQKKKFFLSYVTSSFSYTHTSHAIEPNWVRKFCYEGEKIVVKFSLSLSLVLSTTHKNNIKHERMWSEKR